ncbi:hypothetical protein HYPSUDRAFT_35727 [Hypholoma sublateritium FD-334 SS-4]|uniref:Carboxylic ester hydrolase n=1 Tax=Hypholoma sublateritium (strain FD-334 SS-4) TaxID=945553 RepID=A0A0D2PF38_HYPSF|nr:hypothetical protein HYPSUDRAFT_35727 [Hypholoma sublateritium FD-334 SS-4]
MFAFNLLLAASLLFSADARPATTSSLAGSSSVTRVTPLGIAVGVLDPDGAYRFPVKYGSAARWQPSTVATSWGLPTGASTAAGLPLTCPQNDADPSTFTEDCLSLILYVPPSFNVVTAAPTLVWIHGGSFIVGSATDPGLDGSKLALATNSIVAVIQYRLGTLGFMAPNNQTNLGLKDTVTALKFLRTVLPSFGGSPSKITLAGQSSGASAIRALLGTPSAASLFRSAILQSDTMDYGFLGTSTQATLVSSFAAELGCGSSSSCLNALPLYKILNAENDLINNAAGLDAAAGSVEPIRPVLDGTFLTSPLDSTAPFPSVSKPILVTTVLNEAGPAIYGASSLTANTLSADTFQLVCEGGFGDVRAAAILNSPFYVVSGTDARVQLQTLGTDQVWRCPSWTFSRAWVQNGGTAFVGQFVVGSTYPANAGLPFCAQAGVVCHQDDIMIVFGTAPNPTSAQATLITQMQAHYKAFLASGNPNAAGVPAWTAAGTSDVHPLVLGGSGEVAVAACTPTFWGVMPTYDYQVFNE